MARQTPTPLIDQVRKHAARTGCKCDLQPGATWESLLPLGAGCTRGHGLEPGYVCPTLLFYREKIGIPSYESDA